MRPGLQANTGSSLKVQTLNSSDANRAKPVRSERHYFETERGDAREAVSRQHRRAGTQSTHDTAFP